MHTWGQVHWYMWPGTLVHGAKYTGTGGQVHWYMGPSTLVHGAKYIGTWPHVCNSYVYIDVHD